MSFWRLTLFNTGIGSATVASSSHDIQLRCNKSFLFQISHLSCAHLACVFCSGSLIPTFQLSPTACHSLLLLPCALIPKIVMVESFGCLHSRRFPGLVLQTTSIYTSFLFHRFSSLKVAICQRIPLDHDQSSSFQGLITLSFQLSKIYFKKLPGFVGLLYLPNPCILDTIILHCFN